ncbi:MAG: thioredoxin domain-containing protein [Anaerolineae bacterium]|nr:thioredoxin domain-containing protein [Anaerolineae bacterium]
MTNHLANASSPYLLQHANNPVDWYPWDDEALQRARQEDKPIFLSIGYAACHWCHVMAHESFEDPAIAALMNASFVCIKVDREERPDLDSIFMNFLVSTTGQGGWPMSVFLTPEGRPFYAGTYFPPVRHSNLPAFSEVLEAVARLWRTDRAGILSSSENLTRSLVAQRNPSSAGKPIELQLLGEAVQGISDAYNWQNGGWGAAPKFPQPMTIEFLLRQASRGDQTSLELAIHALHAMARGGMYDMLGGGFARYSVDPTWLVPHFEKMLYDNAQLALTYLHAYQLTGEIAFREVCEATLDFILREMTHPLGGFYSSLDADSEGEEGKYYMWTPEEIRGSALSDDDAQLLIEAYGVTASGNFEGRNILRRVMTDEQLASQFHAEAGTIACKLRKLSKSLFNERQKRLRPATDDKVLVSWNALALAAFSEAGKALNRADYLQAAVSNADFILQHMLQDGRLRHSWRAGQAKVAAFLEDYAGLGLGLLSLYQADPDPRWYQAALDLLEQIITHFRDPAGGFYDTSDEGEALLYRPHDLQDNATPSGNALGVQLLLKLAAFEGRSDWQSIAQGMLEANLSLVMRYPTAFAGWLSALDFALGPIHQVAVLGEPDDPLTGALLSAVYQRYQPRLVLAASTWPPPAGTPALLAERPLLDEKPTAYACEGFVCQQPTNDPQVLLKQLG